MVGAGLDRAEHLLRLGGGEDELDVVGRLLDQLEQGVEALRGDHVRLVDDVHLEAARDRREEGAFAQVTGVVNATVAGRVDLDDVDRTGRRRAPGPRRTRTRPHGSGVGPFSQFSERARMRALEVLPQPRGPEKR